MSQAHGVSLDAQTRCAHWKGPTDVIAIKFPCCDKFYACYDCHAALETHPAQRWPSNRFTEPAVLCGVCGAELSIVEYMSAEFVCPVCSANFNPGCANHYHLYFED